MTQYYDWWINTYDERMYGFVFFSTSLLDYGGCTVFTEEGLDRVVDKYRQMELYQNEPIEKLRLSLRWSPCDAPHHMQNEDIFAKVCSELDTVSERYYSLEDPEFSAAVEEGYLMVVEGILKFRKARLPIVREDILVTMLWGDQSPEEISHFIKACNSPAAADRYMKEMDVP